MTELAIAMSHEPVGDVRGASSRDHHQTDTHVLNDEWTFYLNERPPKGINQEEYERSIHKWGVFSTIEVRPASSISSHITIDLNSGSSLGYDLSSPSFLTRHVRL